MKLTQIAAQPQLIKITLDDEQIREKYNDSLDFWIYDRQPIDQFIKFAQMRGENYGEIVEAINAMIMDEDGSLVIKEGMVLPTDVMTKVIGRVIETLGK
jgi:hypothetical protein